MREILLVVRHEIVNTVSKRSYWIMTIGLPLLVVVFTISPQLLAASFESESGREPFGLEDDQVVGYVDRVGLIERLPTSVRRARLKPYPDTVSAREALEAGEIDLVYLVPADYLERGEVTLIVRDFSPIQNLETSRLMAFVIDVNLVGDERLAQLIDNPGRRATLQQQAPVVTSTQEEGGPVSTMTPFVITFILFILITMTGSLMLTSVAKEKENRTVEVLLLSLPARRLMFGKLLGLGAVALLQMAIWFAGVSVVFGRGVEAVVFFTRLLTPSFVMWASLYLLFGYVLYASLLGAIGALAPSVREGSQFSFLIIFPLFLVLILNPVFGESPDGALATALSLFPLTAPVAMVARLAATQVPIWQPVISLIGLGLTTSAFVSLAARFFRADTLLSSAAISRRRILSAFREAADRASR